MGTSSTPWWKRAVGYQIYPRSFADSDGDGIGDIPDIVSKLDYLAELGIGFVWLSDVDRGITADGPALHDRLREMHRETLAGRDVVTVGETWSATPATALLYSGRERAELSMVFQFEHVTTLWHETRGKWDPKPFDLVTLKRVMNTWQRALADDGWNSLFWNNHDLPRAVSTYGDDGEYRVRSAKLLATVLHLMRGTPYIYQGEELGMTNAGFTELAQYRDVETLNRHALLSAAGTRDGAGMSERNFLSAAARTGRDNARTPMPWSDAPHGGFTTGEPWIEANRTFDRINARDATRDPESVFAHYRTLAALRRAHDVIVDGDYAPFAQDHPAVFGYVRRLGGVRLTVLANFGGDRITFEVPKRVAVEGECLIANVGARCVIAGSLALEPWEAFTVLSCGGEEGSEVR